MNKFAGLAISLICIFNSNTVLSKEITIAFEGYINFVRVLTFDPLNGDVELGTTFSGTYTYDTDLPDNNPTETVGGYQSYEYPNGISLNIGGHSGDSRTASVPLHYKISLTTNSVQDIQTIDTDFEGFNAAMQIYLEDLTGTALSTTDLLETAPVLSDYDTRFFGLKFRNNASCCGDDVIFNGVITDMYLVPTPVTIDIKPGNDHNKINPNSKKRIAVAILGSIDFDATQIVDFTTVGFGPAEAPPVHDGNVEDVNGDGFMDMVFHFKTQETGIVCGDTEATLTGETFGGIQFTGTDTLKTVGCK